MDGISIEPLNANDSDAWGDAIGIIEASFPANELRGAAELRAEVGRALAEHDPDGNQVKTLLARQLDETVGVAILEEITDLSVVYLWYMAISPAFRSCGIGSALLGGVWHDVRGSGIWDGLVFEVEPAIGSDSDSSRRRIRFYESNGFYLLPGVEYTPPFGSGPQYHETEYWLMGRTTRDLPRVELAERGIRASLLRSSLNGPQARAEEYVAKSLLTLRAEPVDRS
jgi:ribosomal protein S18 acetylase RimI-like enzyme